MFSFRELLYFLKRKPYTNIRVLSEEKKLIFFFFVLIEKNYFCQYFIDNLKFHYKFKVYYKAYFMLKSCKRQLNIFLLQVNTSAKKLKRSSTEHFYYTIY